MTRSIRNRTGCSRRHALHPFLDSLEERTLLSPYLVTTTADGGPGSLRDAIISINNDSTNQYVGADGIDEIDFNIPFNDSGHVYYKDDGNSPSVSSSNIVPVPTLAIDGVTPITSDTQLADSNLVGAGNTIDPDWAHSWWSIQPTSPLPYLTQSATIDGYSQPGSSRNTVTVGDNAVLTIELSGAGTASSDRLQIAANNCVVQGLVVNRFNAMGDNSVGISLGGANSSVRGCFIGTDPSGTLSQPNSIGVGAGPGSRVGVDGHDANPEAERNVISGNSVGVDAEGYAVIAGNYIGTDASGIAALGNGQAGIELGAYTNVGHTLVGSDGDGVGDEFERNVISGNPQNGGIVVFDSFDQISGNFIGTDATGTFSLGQQGSGVTFWYSSHDNVLGYDSHQPVASPTAQRNVISGMLSWGVEMQGERNVVAGNFIGTDANGTAAVPNGTGVHVDGGSYNRIGTDGVDAYDLQLMPWGDGSNVPTSGQELVIAGTDGDGLFHIRAFDLLGVRTDTYEAMEGGTLHLVSADASGGIQSDTTESSLPTAQGQAIADLKQQLPGLLPPHVLSGVETNQVLSDVALITGQNLERNIISGNLYGGVGFQGDGIDDDTVAGNYIGLDVTGTRSLNNAFSGSYGTGVGSGPASGVGNRIVGNVISTAGQGNGININQFISGQSLSQTIIAGNYIGTDKTGRTTTDADGVPLGCQNGVWITNAGTTDTVIENNVIGGCYQNGIALDSGATNSGPTGTVITGNFIGTNVYGDNLGNPGSGIALVRTTNTQIVGNTIAFNGTAPVFSEDVGIFVVVGSTGNVIHDNSIHDNGDGISLGTDVWQDSPVLIGVSTSTGPTTWVAGTLHSTPNTSFTIDFYANAAPDRNGYFEGQSYLGSNTVPVITNNSGDASFNVPVGAVALGEWVTATATGASNTSEFSKPFQKANISPTTTQVTALVASPTYGQAETFTATVIPLFPSDGTPTGTVTFSDGGAVLGTECGTSSGGALTASLTTSALRVGTHSITATYNGDAGFSGSKGSTSLLVQQTTATLAVAAAPATAYTNQPVTFTVTASVPSWVTLSPTGVADVYDGTQFLGEGSFSQVPGSNTSIASVTVRIADPGGYALTIRGSDDSGNFAFQSCFPSLTVEDGAPTIREVTTPTTPTAGLLMTLTATICDPPNGVPPTGTVSFYDGVSFLGMAPVTVSGTVGTAVLPPIPAPAAGCYRIRTIYKDPYGYAVDIPAGEVTNVTSGRLGSWYSSRLIATDGSGNLFVADLYNTVISEVHADGTITTVAQDFSPILGLAADSMGHLFVEDPYGEVIELSTDAPEVRSTVITLNDTDSYYADLAVDNSGDLFVAYDNGIGEVIDEATPGADGLLVPPDPNQPFAQLDFGDYRGSSIAVDAAGNVYVWFRGSDRLYEASHGGTVTQLTGGYGGSYEYVAEGIAVTPTGDLLVPSGAGFAEEHPEGTYATPVGIYPFPVGTENASDLAVDTQGNVYVASPSDVYRIDMSPNLAVRALTTSDVQTALSTQGGSITLGATSTSSLDNILTVLADPQLQNVTGSITVSLAGGAAYQHTDANGNLIPFGITAPPGVNVTIVGPSSGQVTITDLQVNGGNVEILPGPTPLIFMGGSPALTVRAGRVTIGPGATFLTATNSPTILVAGGSLTLRGAVVQESTAYAQAALLVTGGAVDLGTTADPGGNTFNVNGAGTLIQNLSGNPIPAIGDTFENNGVANAPSIYVLNPTASGALTVSNNTSITIPGVVLVDSTSPAAVSIGNKAQVSAWASGVPVPDPLAGLTGPGVTDSTGRPLPKYGSFVVGGNTKTSYTINPGIYSQINISGSAIVTMNPGIYIIEGGGLAVSGGASVTGTGVMIYNAGSNYPSSGGNFGGITLSGSGTFNLSAPTSGPYAGILIFQSRQNTRALSISGNILTGMNGSIYAANALLSVSGGATLQAMLDVGTLSISGGASLTQMAAGSDGSGDTSGIANTLLAGDLSVYIIDPSGLFTSDELARIEDAINAWDALLAPYSVTITEVTDPTLANIVIDTGDTSACGGAAAGVLGCFNAPAGEITILQGWNWYAGSDPSQIGSDQYDFETTVLHELGHALGLGGSTDPTSPMYEVLAAGVADRTVTAQDLNIPDPPEGADPQMAAGFVPLVSGQWSVVSGQWTVGGGQWAAGPAAPSSPMGHPVAVGAATLAGPAGLMPLALAASSGPWSVVQVQSTAAATSTSAQASSEPSLVIQGMEANSSRSGVIGIEPEASELPATLDGRAASVPWNADPLIGPAAREGGDETDPTNGQVAIPTDSWAGRAVDAALHELAPGVEAIPAEDGLSGATTIERVRIDGLSRPAGSPWKAGSWSMRSAAILLAAGWLGRGATRARSGNLTRGRRRPRR